MQTTNSPAESRLVVLDTFRAIAILAVLLHHFLSRYAPPDEPRNIYGYTHTYPHWLDLGQLGVQFFFIISGFVIFMTLERCHHLFEFWFRRLARLYPAYVVAMLITFVVANLAGPPEFHTDPKDLLIDLTFLTRYINDARWVEPAYWSLVVELQFYFLIGLVYAAARPRFALAWTALLGFALILWALGPTPETHVFRSVAKNILLIGYMPHFTAGIVFFKLYSGHKQGWWLLAIGAAVTYMVTAADSSWSEHAVHASMFAAFVLFVFGKLEWLAIRPLVFIGEISYSLYLLHQYVGVTLIATLTRVAGASDLLAATVAAAACIALAYAVTSLVEIPAKRALLSWARGRLFMAFARFPTFAFA
jgi:peptidoglycan/LPS O-acetylase OafA/YrhL